MGRNDAAFLICGLILYVLLTAKVTKDFRLDFLTCKFPRYFWRVARKNWREGVIDPMKSANPSTVKEFIFYLPRLIFQNLFFTLLELLIPLIGFLGWSLVPVLLFNMAYYMVDYLYQALK